VRQITGSESPLCPKLAQHVGAVAIGQAEVEQHEIGRRAAQLHQRFRGRAHRSQAVPQPPELEGQEACDVRVVFDREDLDLHPADFTRCGH
jgi:hypothetical protein